MPISAALAVVAVDDLAEARAFYHRLFDRPADEEPMPTLAQWNLDAGGVQVVDDAERSGSSMVTLLVSDLDEMLIRLGDQGVAVGDVVDGVISRITQTSDPAGNTITFAELSG